MNITLLIKQIRDTDHEESNLLKLKMEGGRDPSEPVASRRTASDRKTRKQHGALWTERLRWSLMILKGHAFIYRFLIFMF